MKKLSSHLSKIVFSVLIVAGTVSVSHAQQFEGVINFKLPDEQSSGTNQMQYMIKNDKVRMQFGQGDESGAMLYLPKESKMVVLIHKMHAYMKMDFNKMSDKSHEGKWENSKLNKTGQMKTIAGHECEIWKISNDKNYHLTMCMAKGLGRYMPPPNLMSRKHAPAWARKIRGKDYMPLEVIENSNGKEDIQMLATHIEKKPLDENLFKIPEGYNDMGAMMKKMLKSKNKQHN